MRILIVDDDPNLRELYCGTLSALGHRTQAVAGAGEAMLALAAAPPDLIVLDLRLGRAHGLDVAREVSRRGLPARIIVVSGTADFTRSELMALSPAIRAVLRKPVDIENLVAEVAAIDTR